MHGLESGAFAYCAWCNRHIWHTYFCIHERGDTAHKRLQRKRCTQRDKLVGPGICNNYYNNNNNNNNNNNHGRQFQKGKIKKLDSPHAPSPSAPPPAALRAARARRGTKPRPRRCRRYHRTSPAPPAAPLEVARRSCLRHTKQTNRKGKRVVVHFKSSATEYMQQGYLTGMMAKHL